MALRNLALAVFFGGGLSTVFATRAIFRIADSRKQGGHFSGAVLRSFQLVRVAAYVALALSTRFVHGSLAAPLALGALFVVETFIDRHLRKLRAQIGGSTEGLDPKDPRRKQFGLLHGVSVLLLMAQTLVAAVALAQ